MAEKYILRVTCGPSYDASTHVEVPVNQTTSTPIISKFCTTNLKVRVQNYRGLPRNSPTTSAYFSHAPHKHDQYSIGFSFVPHTSVPGAALVFGNDFDRPVRDRLPPGFGTAFKIVKWAIDPGLDGDVYADKPYLYGPLLSSINILRVSERVRREEGGKTGGKDEKEEDGMPPASSEEGILEGADGGGEEVRREKGLPETEAERKKWALKPENLEQWTWEVGRLYQADFFNGFLDFNDFTLKLPGFSLNILGHIEEKGETLRYVLKNKTSGDVFFVVLFTLHLKTDIEKEEAEAKSKGSTTGQKGQQEFQPKEDDLD